MNGTVLSKPGWSIMLKHVSIAILLEPLLRTQPRLRILYQYWQKPNSLVKSQTETWIFNSLWQYSSADTHGLSKVVDGGFTPVECSRRSNRHHCVNAWYCTLIYLFTLQEVLTQLVIHLPISFLSGWFRSATGRRGRRITIISCNWPSITHRRHHAPPRI